MPNSMCEFLFTRLTFILTEYTKISNVYVINESVGSECDSMAKKKKKFGEVCQFVQIYLSFCVTITKLGVSVYVPSHLKSPFLNKPFSSLSMRLLGKPSLVWGILFEASHRLRDKGLSEHLPFFQGSYMKYYVYMLHKGVEQVGMCEKHIWSNL